MTSFDMIEYIKDEMLLAGLPEKLVLNMVFLANDQDEGYVLMSEWMKNTDTFERKLIQEKMMKVLDKYNRAY